MRAHAKTIGDRLEIFFLLVNAVPAAPPPCLVNERAVSGIHEADDAVIDADRHFGVQVGEFVFRAEFLDLRSGLGSFCSRGESRARRRGVGNENPNKTVLFFAFIAAGIDAIHFEILIGGERRDQLALAVVDVERPAVVSTLEIFSVESAAVQGHAAMRARVAQCERLSHAVAAEDQRDLQQRRLMQLIAMDAIGGQSAIPEAGEHERVGRLALREVEFGHGGLSIADF